MWRTACKIISLLLAAAVMLAAVGCGAKPGTDGGAGDDGAGAAAAGRSQQLFDKGILTMNNLKIARVNGISGGEYDTYPAISGLADRTVEDSINARIKEVYEDMMTGDYVPAYRGIAVRLRETAGLDETRSVNIDVEYNAGDLLSLLACCWVYRGSYDSSGYFSSQFSYCYCRALNFDLADGSELSLGDIFLPGTDHADAVNSLIDDTLMRSDFDDDSENVEYQDIVLTAPFTGIKPEQKFYIDINGDINIIIDEYTPEFYTRYSMAYITLYSQRLAGMLNISRDSARQLYTDGSAVYNLAWDRSPDKPANTESIYERRTERPNFICGYERTVPRDMSDAARSTVDRITFDRSTLPPEINDIYTGMVRRYGSEGWIMNGDAYVESIDVRNGGALQLRRTYYYYTGLGSDDEGYDPLLNDYYQDYYMIDADSGEIIPCEELFVDPSRARSLLSDVIAEGLTSGNIRVDPAAAESFARDIVGHINGACLMSDGICLSFDLSHEQFDDMAKNALNVTDELYAVYSAVSAPSYKDIGCENLKIFAQA